MVFESGEVVSPELPGAEMAIVELVGKFEMDPLDVVGEDGGAGSESYGEQL